MSVCEFINWLIAEEIWEWFNELNGLYTVHSVFAVLIEHDVHSLHTVHTLHSVRTLHSVHIEHSVYTVHTQVYTIDGMNHV
jgi:hypothetical protein